MLERRRIPRTCIFAAAKAITGRHPPVPYDCSVRNISRLGACLEFGTTSAIPSVFELTFDAGRTLRECHVIWRTTTEVGVAFLDPQASPLKMDRLRWSRKVRRVVGRDGKERL